MSVIIDGHDLQAHTISTAVASAIINRAELYEQTQQQEQYVEDKIAEGVGQLFQLR